MNEKFDVILVLGSGIYADGQLPASAKAMAAKTAELVSQGTADKVITCGKWSYALDFTPPITEAQAVKDELVRLGVPPENIMTESESVSTVSNICLAKEQYLIPNHWRRVVLVGINPQHERALFNLEYVLGEGYRIACVLADFTYPPEKMRQAVAKEQARMQEAKRFLGTLPRGNHQRILQAATKDLHENWLRKAYTTS